MLSGLENRRAFYEAGSQALEQAAPRPPAPLALLMIDIDHFKAINDALGHAGGDAAIRDIAARIEAHRPPGAHAGRLGGEEFALLLPGASLADATALGEALVAATAAATLAYEAHRIAYTISIGATQAVPGEDFDALVARADAALYRAKHEGRNRLVAM
jgi:diguanylate cyclase (GGDEF)-like protein